MRELIDEGEGTKVKHRRESLLKPGRTDYYIQNIEGGGRRKWVGFSESKRI
jgi:hypothetical protein